MKAQDNFNVDSNYGATYKTVTLVVSALVLFFISFMSSGLNVALPMIGQEFPASAVVLSWVLNAELLSIGVFLIPAGRISEIFGIKKIYLWGIILFTLTSVLAGFSTSIFMLIVFVALRGVSCAMIFGNSMAMLSAVFPAKERGRALGINVAFIYTGMSLGPYLGGMLIEHFGWRSLFFPFLPACIVALVLTLWKIKGEWSSAKGEQFDIVGAVIIGLSLVAVMYGFSSWPEPAGFLLTAAGFLGLMGFLNWETRVKSPILDVRAFRSNRLFVFSNLANLISYSATSAIIFLMSLYLQYIKALTPEEAGLILLSQPAMLVLLSPIAGILSDKFEPRILATSGMLLTAIGLSIFSFLQENTSLILIVCILMLIGSGFATFITPNNNAIMGSVMPRHYAVASSITATLRQMGQTFSMGITMIVMSILMGRAAIAPQQFPQLLNSTRIAFGIFAVLAFICACFSVLRGKTESPDPISQGETKTEELFSKQ